MRIKKVFILSLLCLLLFTITANADSTAKQKEVEKTVLSLMKHCKNYNAGKIRKYFVNPKKVPVFYKKKYTAKFMKTINQKYLDYSILSTDIKGKNASVRLSVTYLYIPDLYESVFEGLVEYARDKIYANKKISDSASDKYEYKLLKEEYKYIDVYLDEDDYDYILDDIETKQIILTLKKKGKKWKVTKMPRSFNIAIHGGYQDAYDYFFD